MFNICIRLILLNWFKSEFYQCKHHANVPLLESTDFKIKPKNKASNEAMITEDRLRQNRKQNQTFLQCLDKTFFFVTRVQRHMKSKQGHDAGTAGFHIQRGQSHTHTQ